MTSEYTRGHEYDTYHYEDKKHRPLHFTVTKPEEEDVVSKGAYYHAHPEETGRSYPHHDDHRYYEVEKVPVHRTEGHHYVREYEPEHTQYYGE